MINLLLLFAGSAFVLFAYLIFTTVRQHLKLRQFKGPFWAQFTDLYFVWLSCTGRQHEILGEIGDKYGKEATTKQPVDTHTDRSHVPYRSKYAPVR